MSKSANSSAVPQHIPVLLTEVLGALDPQDGETFVDGTFGAGGYSKALLDGAATHVLAIDRDTNTLEGGQALVSAYAPRLVLVEGCFADMEAICGTHGYEAVDGVTLDIGVSSMQIDEAARGFSFAKDGPLDMRMAQSGPTAADVVNDMEEEDLANVIYRFGEERRSRSVARAIVRRRESAPFVTTIDLAEVVRRAVGGKPGRIHPATRTFQALRIFVNAELEQFALGLAAAERLLKPGGRLAVVTFHSLEDRIAKRFFQLRSGQGSSTSRYRPVMDDGLSPSFSCPVRRVVKAGDAELDINPRARSARLRWGIRTEAEAWPLDLNALGVPDVKTAFTG